MTNTNGEVPMNKTKLLLTNILACALLAARASAEFTPQATAVPGSVPQGINYQGRLEDAGFPVTGTRTMVFRVYSALTGGVLLWTSPAQSVSVTLGLFNAVVPVPVTTLVGGGSRYLEVQIDGTLMAPRELLNSVPYALIAKSVEGTIDVSTAGLAINANASATQPAIYISSQTGNVGVGTGSPATAFDVGGSAQFGSGTTKSTFTAAGALNMAAKVTAPDYTATYGLSAATAAFTGDAIVGGKLAVGAPSPGTRLHVSSGVVTVDGAGSAVVVAGTELSVGGSNFVATGGRVGVGTAAPGSKLHLSSGTLIIDGNAANSLIAVGSVGIGAVSPGTRLHVSSGVVTVDGTGAALRVTGTDFSVGGADLVASGGRVGVGAASPGTKLHLSSGTFTIDGNMPTALTTIGSVGVGTASPGTKLHLSSGTLTIDGNSATALTTVGSVGVGTNNPGQALEVASATGNDGILITGGGAQGARLRINSTGAGGRAYHLVSAANASGFGGGKLVISDNTAGDAARLVIDSAGLVGIGADSPASKLHLSSGTLIIDGNAATAMTTVGTVGIGTPSPASKLHMSSGTLTIDGNVATAMTTVGNVGVGTGGSAPADRLEVAGGSARLTAVAGSAGSVKLFSAITAAATTCTTQCGANTACLAAWDSAGVSSTCGTAALANRCLCSGFGN